MSTTMLRLFTGNSFFCAADYIILAFIVNLVEKLLRNNKRANLKVIKLEYILKLKIKRNNWLLASSQSLCFILSIRMYSSFITSRRSDSTL